MIKAIIFDCFGVLVGSGFKDTYTQAGGDVVKDEAFMKGVLYDASTGAISSSEFSQRIADQLGITVEKWLEVVSNAEQPNKLLFQYIRQLKSRYKLAILSNANRGVMQIKMTPDQLQLFDAIVVSAEVNMIKPFPEVYQLTAQKLDVAPKECVFTDDSEAYVDAARDVGMKAIWYQDFDQFKAELETHL